MTLKLKEKTSVFLQKEIKRNSLKKNIRKSLGSDDATLFYMLTGTSDKHKINIEKIHKNVFQNAKIVKITVSDEDVETLEIMLDPQMRKQVKSNLNNMKEKDLVSWSEIKDTI